MDSWFLNNSESYQYCLLRQDSRLWIEYEWITDQAEQSLLSLFLLGKPVESYGYYPLLYLITTGRNVPIFQNTKAITNILHLS